MLSRQNRLKKDADFRRIYRYGKKMHGNFFDIYFLQRGSNTRFGVVVTTRTTKEATKRNRNKRYLRHLIIDQNNVWPRGFEIIIKIKKEFEESKKGVIKKELAALLEKIC